MNVSYELNKMIDEVGYKEIFQSLADLIENERQAMPTISDDKLYFCTKATQQLRALALYAEKLPVAE